MQKSIQTGLFELSEILAAARARKGLVLLTAGALFAASAFFVFSLNPVYTAETLVLLSTVQGGDLGDGRSSGAGATDPYLIRGEVDILRSEDLARDVIESLRLEDNPEFREMESSLPVAYLKATIEGVKAILGRDAHQTTTTPRQWSAEELKLAEIVRDYLSRLGISNDGRSPLVRVSFSGEGPQLIKDIANAHAKAYLDTQAKRRIATKRQSSDWLNSELNLRANEVRDAETAVQRFRAENGLFLTRSGGSEHQQTTTDQELVQGNEQLTTARGDLARTSAKLDQVKQVVQAGVMQGTTEIIDSPVLVKLRDREAAALTSVERVTALFGEKSPSVNASRIELRSVQETIKRELQRLQSSAAADLEAAAARVRLLEQNVQNVKTRKLVIDKADVELRALEAVAASKRHIYDAVLTRYNVLLAEQKFEASDGKIVSSASAPTRPTFPRTSLFLAVGLFMSSVAGVGVAYAVERTRQRGKNLNAYALSFDLRPLTSVPLPDDKGFMAEIFWERVRSLRSAVLNDAEPKGRVLLVTSSLPREGKSLVAASLAQSITSAGLPTLLIDADLRRPSVARSFSLRPVSAGFERVLSGQISAEDAIVPTEHPRLFILPTSRDGVMHVDALSQNKFRAIIQELRQTYPIIIIDTPPIGVVSDALTMVSSVDEVVFVANSATPESVVKRVVRSLKEHPVPIAGLVLTGKDEEDEFLNSVDIRGYYVTNSSRPNAVLRSNRIVPFRGRNLKA